jgi:hypothetical protein
MHLQLGPIIQSDDARRNGLGISYFERIIQRQLYREHPESRKAPLTHTESIAKEGQAKSLMLNDCVAPFVNLVRNYRSHSGKDRCFFCGYLTLF